MQKNVKNKIKIAFGNFVKVNNEEVFAFKNAFDANLNLIKRQDPILVYRGNPKDCLVFSHENFHSVIDFLDIYSRDGIKNRYVNLVSLKPVNIFQSANGWCHSSFVTNQFAEEC